MQKPTYTVWMHGNSLQVEHPDRVDELWRTGFLGRIVGKPDTENWVHFAIPTLVIADSHRLRATRVVIVFRTDSPDAIVNTVHVYDGERRIAEHNNLRLYADAGWQTFDIPEGTPHMRMGIGISICVSFGVEPMRHGVDFISVACEFV